MYLKFAHIADCHLDAFNRNKFLYSQLNLSFTNAINSAIKNKVDFVLFSGDLFNNASPKIETLVFAINELKKLKTKNIPAYIIAGSHDYTPSGSTILNVLNAAELAKNAYCPVFEDKNQNNQNNKPKLQLIQHKDANIFICGIIGRITGLDKQLYSQLKIEPKKNAFNIFLFHNGIEEFKPKNMKNTNFLHLSELPSGFDYYAGGHIHSFFKTKINNNKNLLVYPGSIYPTNISEFENNKSFGYVLVEVNEDDIELKKINTIPMDFEVIAIEKNIIKLNELELEILSNIEKINCENKIIVLKIKALIEDGKASDFDIGKIEDRILSKGAKKIEKNLSGLVSKSIFNAHFDANISTKELSEKLIDEHLGTIKIDNIENIEEKKNILDLMHILKAEKKQGQTNSNYDENLIFSCKKLFKIQEHF